jgi:hypothetical protein
MTQTYPPVPPGRLGRVGFSITLDDNGSVRLKGGAEYLEMLLSGMFGPSGEELASRLMRVWLLYDTVTDSVLGRLKDCHNVRDLFVEPHHGLLWNGSGSLSPDRGWEDTSFPETSTLGQGLGLEPYTLGTGETMISIKALQQTGAALRSFECSVTPAAAAAERVVQGTVRLTRGSRTTPSRSSRRHPQAAG